jgi:hypothetical protein
MASAGSNLKVMASSPKQMESGCGNRNGQKKREWQDFLTLYLIKQLSQFIQSTSWQVPLLFFNLHIKNAYTPSSSFTVYIQYSSSVMTLTSL